MGVQLSKHFQQIRVNSHHHPKAKTLRKATWKQPRTTAIPKLMGRGSSLRAHLKTPEATAVTSAKPWPSQASGPNLWKDLPVSTIPGLSPRGCSSRKPEAQEGQNLRAPGEGLLLFWILISCQFLKLRCQSTCPSFCIPQASLPGISTSLLSSGGVCCQYSPAPWAHPALGCAGLHWGFLERDPCPQRSFLPTSPTGSSRRPAVCTARLCIGSSRVLSACYRTFLDHRLRSLCL